MKIRDRIRELRRVPASELRPNPKNWRTHPQAQANALRGLLSEVGIADAVLARELADGSLMLVDGHLRAETLGDETVPVLVLDVDEAEADKVLATLDPLAAMAEADAAKLDAILREVDTGSPDVQQLLADLADEAGMYQDEPKKIVEDEVPEPPADLITKPGDLWLLGEHRLLCGDSTLETDIKRLMGGRKANFVFTDPPYGVNVTGKGGDAIAGDISFTAIPLFFDMLDKVVADKCWVYVCGAQSNMLLYAKMFERYFRELPKLIIWDKGKTAVMRANGYHSCFEIVYYSFKGGSGSWWFGGRGSDEADDIWRISRDPSSTYEHPTQKPIALPARAITNTCPKDGLVFEPFCGAGSTLLASEQCGRTCYAMELDPRFVDVIVKRWETLTGKKATLANE